MQEVDLEGKQLGIAVSLADGNIRDSIVQRRAAQSFWCMGWMWRASSWA